MELTNLKIGGMQTEACATKLTDALTAIDGVEKTSVIFASGQANVNFNSDKLNQDDLKDAVAAAGFEVLPAHGEAGNCCGSCS